MITPKSVLLLLLLIPLSCAEGEPEIIESGQAPPSLQGVGQAATSSAQLSFLTGAQTLNPATFKVSVVGHVARVRYLADAIWSDAVWTLGDSDARSNGYSYTHLFSQEGTRTIHAVAYDAQGYELGRATQVIHVGAQPSAPPAPNPPAAPAPKTVPYFYQYANALSPGATCQNTSVAMLLAWLGWSGAPDDITASWGKNYAQSPAGLANMFNSYAQDNGFSQRLVARTSGTLSGLRSLLAQGKPTIIHGYFTGYGHVVVVTGYDGAYYTVNDPAGEWSQSFKGGYPFGWSSTIGKGIRYPAAAFEDAVATSNGHSYLPLWYHELID